MTSALRQLSTPSLRALVRALDQGSLSVPCSAAALQGLVPQGAEASVASALRAIVDGPPTRSVAAVLSLLVEERGEGSRAPDRIDLVWTGPEATGSLNRDTAVVVRELFERAERSVLIATYALDSGERVRAIFEPLAVRLDRGDPLEVSLFANIHPSDDRSRPAAEVIAAFAARFRREVWPGRVLPRVFFDPRSLVTDGPTRASMHAKCVVIDDRLAFVTSANFTQAAQRRNVEVGLVVEDSGVSRALRSQFANLVGEGAFRELTPWVGTPSESGTAGTGTEATQ